MRILKTSIAVSAVLLAALMPRSVADACALVHARSTTATQIKATEPRWVGPAMSGSWYSASRSGEGFVLQILPDGEALAIWFTYPPKGSAAKQAWILGQNGKIDGNRIQFTNAYTTRGPKFGPSFDPSLVQRPIWGEFSFEFSDCNNVMLRYTGPAAWGSGERALTRLTEIDELGCSAKTKLTSSGARTISSLKQRSAAWFDRTHSGEGWFLEELANNRSLLYWFTYDDAGEQVWTVGSTSQPGDQRSFDAMLRPIGTNFGADFKASDVNRTAWGSLNLDFSSCNQASLRYQAPAPFGAGALAPERLTSLAGAVCRDIAAPSQAVGAWGQLAVLPVKQSEYGFARIGDEVFMMGSLGPGANAATSFNLATQQSTNLPNLPGSRDHPVALAIGGEILVAGGYVSSALGGDLMSTGFRIRPGAAQWSIDNALPPVVASGAAVVNNFAYFSDASGSVYQYDPRAKRYRQLPMSPEIPRDHSQLVEFQGELWQLGGRDERFSETNRVAIFDPSSETWRIGPSSAFPRAGFAAASNADRIVIAGGELIFGGTALVATVEAIAVGANQFERLPNLPRPVHGMSAAFVGKKLYVLGGSRQAGVARNFGDVQVLEFEQ
jgi:N-acetylneuraminic acid mutarotase